MRLRQSTPSKPALAASTAMTALVVLLAGCGAPGSSGTGSTVTAASSHANLSTCAPVAGNTFVALADDKHLQNPDNIVPAVNAAAATADPEIITLLDSVSAALDTPALVDLNKSVDVDRKTSAQAAEAFVAAKGLQASDQVGAGRKVVVGAPNFSEGATLANIYVQVLASAGYAATTQDEGNRELYLTDLESGAVTVMPEYVSTLTEFLNAKENGAGATPVASPDLKATMGHLTDLGKAVGLAFGTPADAQDQNAFAVTTAFAEKYKISTLSELGAVCGKIILGGPPECPQRPFCQIGLVSTYGLDIASFTSLDAGGTLTKEALRQGKITLGLIFSSDAALAG
jgi:osmoprotectant transport system substrate-binding protein